MSGESQPPIGNDRRSSIEELRALVARLRAPGGCPWDREQTHASLRAGLIEEAYEVVGAIDTGNPANLREELGDLLLQVVFHAQIAAEDRRFTLDDVANAIVEKLVRRHPHVFGKAECADSAAVLGRWEEIKRAEKGESSASVIAGVDPALPALMRAQQIQKKAARIGFDWSEIGPVLEKVREELREIESAISGAGADAAESARRIEEETGDLLFAVVNLARKLKLDAEIALTLATKKFVGRFREMERIAAERGLDLRTMSLSGMDILWEEVKGAAVHETPR